MPTIKNRQCVNAFIERMEGKRYSIYNDRNESYNNKTPSIKTIGIGFNLQRADAVDVLEKCGVKIDGDLIVVNNGQQGFRQDKLSSLKLRLNDDQINKLRDYTIDEACRIIESKVPGVLDKMSGVAQAGLISIVFNYPKFLGPILIDFLKNDDFISAANHIREDAKRYEQTALRGLAKRREEEARLLALGTGENLTAALKEERTENDSTIPTTFMGVFDYSVLNAPWLTIGDKSLEKALENPLIKASCKSTIELLRAKEASFKNQQKFQLNQTIFDITLMKGLTANIA